MLNLHTIRPETPWVSKAFGWFGGLVLACLLLAMLLEAWWLAFLPMLPLGAFLALVDYQKIYLFLWAAVPISTEVYFGGFGTDLPVEPLIIGLMGLYLLQLMSKPELLSGAVLSNPLTILLLLHLFWTLVATVFAADLVISLKFLLAKIWYVLSFYFLTTHILRNFGQLKTVLWWFFIPFWLATFKVVAHHALLDFGFKEINIATSPFFRNHVNYAAIIALSLPLLWFMWGWYKRQSLGWWLIGAGLGLLLFALIFAYTRAAYVALVMAIGAFWVIRFGLVKWVLLAATALLLLIFGYLVQNNKFMDYAPTERTVAHTELEDIVAATYKLEDVSTMERYYRWIAGVRMASQDPYTGFGGGSFYHNYKHYTLNRFQTYVSDNPEQSGIHNYYLMLLAEQGIIGLLIFVLLNFTTLLYGQKLYHSLYDERYRSVVMAVCLSQVVIFAFLLMNDMVETDKVGSFFFFNMAVLVVVPQWAKSDQAAQP